VEAEPVLLFFGIIDFLQLYNLRKRAEKVWKGMTVHGDSVSGEEEPPAPTPMAQAQTDHAHARTHMHVLVSVLTHLPAQPGSPIPALTRLTACARPCSCRLLLHCLQWPTPRRTQTAFNAVHRSCLCCARGPTMRPPLCRPWTQRQSCRCSNVDALIPV
jgi:hypothetical protein